MQPYKLFLDLDTYNSDRMQTCARSFGLKQEYVWDTIIDNIGVEASPNEVWEAIKVSDEIYADTRLIMNYSSMGSGNLFNMLMYKAIEEGIENKKVHIFGTYDKIQWDALKPALLDGAFKKNYLYVESSNENSFKTWEQVDIDTLLEDKF